MNTSNASAGRLVRPWARVRPAVRATVVVHCWNVPLPVWPHRADPPALPRMRGKHRVRMSSTSPQRRRRGMQGRWRRLFLSVTALAFVMFFAGCAQMGLEYAPKGPYLAYHKELPAAERAIEAAR